MTAKITHECPAHPGEFAIDGATGARTHECMPDEMRCVYCGERLAPYPCNGCGKFLTAKRMHEAGSTDGVWRCEECYP